MDSKGIPVQIFRLGLGMVLLVLGAMVDAADWGSITVGKEKGLWTVWLENSLIKVGYHDAPWGCDCIGTFVDKRTNVDVACNVDYRYNPNDNGFQRIDTAVIQAGGPTHQSVILKFSAGPNGYNRRQIVTIFKEKPYIEILYLGSGHVYDGAGEIQGEHRYAIYGAEEYAQQNGISGDPYGGGHNRNYGFYDNQNNQNPDALLYKGGYGIIGMYKPSNGAGFGVATPIKIFDWLQLNAGKGFERWFGNNNFSVYYFPVKDGAEEIIQRGKQIIDEVVPMPQPVTIMPNGGTFGDSVRVTLETQDTRLKIRYTTDGSEPNRRSKMYVSPLLLTEEATIKARSYTPDYGDSGIVTTADFVVESGTAVHLSSRLLGQSRSYPFAASHAYTIAGRKIQVRDLRPNCALWKERIYIPYSGGRAFMLPQSHKVDH